MLDDPDSGRHRGRDAIAVCVLAGRAVLDDGDVVTGRGAVAYDGITRHTQPEHENATQSITPGMRMKSA
jgi:hypothetical protein